MSEEIALNKSKYEILSNDGWKDFKGVIKRKDIACVSVTTQNGKYAIVSCNHRFIGKNNNTIRASESFNKFIKTNDGYEKIVNVKLTTNRDVYDIYDVADTHTFIGNGIVHHNCHLMEPFWASVFPIVSSSKKAKVFMCSTPNGTGNLFYDIYTGSIENKNGWANDKILWNEIPGRDEKWVKEIKGGLASEEKFEQEFNCQFLNSGTGSMGEDAYNHMKSYISKPVEVLMDGKYKIFEHYQEGRIYVAGVDTAEGIGGDFSCIKILDITDLKEITEVAEYYDNTISVSEFANKVYEILCHWGKPLACIERNNQGGQVVDRLGLDMGYMDKIVCWGSKLAGRKNTQLLGMIASRNTKYNAVANARYFYNDKMVVQFKNEDSLNEVFKDFVKLPNDSWGAISGKHDDRTMALVWALMVLHDDIVEQYFTVDEYDDCGKPSKLTPNEHLFKSFEPATSIYTNELVDGIENSQISPVYFGTSTQQASDFAELEADGWVSLGGSMHGGGYRELTDNESAFFDKYF
jgi:hypothetical protein